jgi:taurine dioxygenase
LSNITDDGKPTGVRRAGENWHSDMCYTARPPRGTMLYAREIPTLNGLPLGDTVAKSLRYLLANPYECDMVTCLPS